MYEDLQKTNNLYNEKLEETELMREKIQYQEKEIVELSNTCENNKVLQQREIEEIRIVNKKNNDDQETNFRKKVIELEKDFEEKIFELGKGELSEVKKENNILANELKKMRDILEIKLEELEKTKHLEEEVLMINNKNVILEGELKKISEILEIKLMEIENYEEKLKNNTDQINELEENLENVKIHKEKEKKKGKNEMEEEFLVLGEEIEFLRNQNKNLENKYNSLIREREMDKNLKESELITKNDRLNQEYFEKEEKLVNNINSLGNLCDEKTKALQNVEEKFFALSAEFKKINEILMEKDREFDNILVEKDLYIDELRNKVEKMEDYSPENLKIERQVNIAEKLILESKLKDAEVAVLGQHKEIEKLREIVMNLEKELMSHKSKYN